MKSIYILILIIISVGFFACKKETPQADIDEKIIKDYLTLNAVPATRTASGLYYIITDTTKGALATFGKKLSVRYEGRILNGAMFDNNKSASSPFTFTLGIDRVIPGWEEGLLYVREGESADFFIPSGLDFLTVSSA